MMCKYQAQLVAQLLGYLFSKGNKLNNFKNRNNFEIIFKCGTKILLTNHFSRTKKIKKLNNRK